MNAATLKARLAGAQPYVLSAESAPPVKWLEPIPLPDALPPVPCFDEAVLPADLRAWVVDIAERMQCPLDYVAIPALVAAGSVIGRRIGIRPQSRTDWTEVANIWGCIVGPPGALKSPAFAEALAPLKRLEIAAAQKNEAALADHKTAMALYKLEREAAEKTARAALGKGDRLGAEHALSLMEPVEPKPLRYLTNDPTAESLGELCAANPNGIMVHRDELLTLFRDLDKPERESARGFFLSGWGGQEGYTFDRIMRGTVRIPAVNVSLLGTTQPGKLANYVRDSLRHNNDGMVQRIQLLAWPDAKENWREVDRFPDTEAKRLAFACYDRLATLTGAMVGAESDAFDGPDAVPFLRFAPDARKAFSEWRGQLEGKIADPDILPAMSAHLSKYRGLVPRLALICHLAGDGTGPIGLEVTLQALALAEYFEAHAVRAYASIAHDDAQAARALWRKIAQGVLSDGFSERDVYRAQWSGLKDRGKVAAALALLVEHDWLAVARTDTGGRPSRSYAINPRVLG